MTVINVKDMSCSHCTGAVLEALEKIDLDKAEARFEDEVDHKKACDAIESVGFEAE